MVLSCFSITDLSPHMFRCAIIRFKCKEHRQKKRRGDLRIWVITLKRSQRKLPQCTVSLKQLGRRRKTGNSTSISIHHEKSNLSSPTYTKSPQQNVTIPYFIKNNNIIDIFMISRENQRNNQIGEIAI